MHALRSLPNYSYDDYCQWEGQWELIDGIAYAMASASDPKHQYMNGKLAWLFGSSLKLIGNKKYQIYLPIDYKINEHTILQPDVCIVNKPILKNYLDFAPLLVIEILSDNTKAKDRYVKLPLYQEVGIKYCLIVDHEKEKIEIYQNIINEFELIKRVHSRLFTFELDENFKINVDFTELWDNT